MKKKKRKLSKKSLRNKADTLWSLVVRKKGGNCCWRCHEIPTKKRRLQAHHLFARSIYSLRYLLKNGVSLCATCHRVFAGNRPLVFALLVLKELLTEEEILEMDTKSKEKPVITIEWYLEYINYLQEELKK